MTIQLDHVIVPSHNKVEGAKALAELLDVPWATSQGTFTLQGAPVRMRVNGMERFVEVRGGGYFFMPGLRAIRFLASTL